MTSAVNENDEGGANQLPGPLQYTLSDFSLSIVDATLANGNEPSPGTKAVPAHSPAFDALSSLFLFDDTSVGEKALPASTWLQLLLAPADRDASDAHVYRAANPLEYDLSLDAANGLLLALARGRLFEDGPIDGFVELERRLVRARAILDAAGELESLLLPSDALAKITEFDVPAIAGRGAQAAHNAPRTRGGDGARAQRAQVAPLPAVQGQPAQPGPDELKFLQTCSYESFYDSDATLPFGTMSLLYRYLPNIHSRAARDDLNGDVRVAAADLADGVRLLLQASAELTASRTARGLPALLRLLAAFPPEFVSPNTSRTTLLADLVDRITYATGKPEMMMRVERQRIYLAAEAAYPSVAELLRRCRSTADRLRAYDGAVRALLSSSQATGLPSVVLIDLEARMAEVADITRSATAEASWNELVELYRADAERASSAGSAATGTLGDSTATSGALLGDQGDFGKVALGRAFRSEAYLSFEKEVASLDLLTMQGRLDALGEGFQSGSMIVIRYLATQSSKLRTQTDLFGSLFVCFPELPRYFSDAQTLDTSTGKRRVGTELYTWCTTSMNSVLSGQFNRDWVNASSGGALLVEDAISPTPHRVVLAKEIYTVDAPLQFAQRFVQATMVALGYDAEPAVGVSWHGLFAHQRAFVEYAHTIGGSAGQELLKFAEQEFRAALKLAGELYLNRLLSPQPATVALTYALPADAPYFRNTDQKRTIAEPLRLVQKAFPHLLSASTSAPSLPGTSAGQSNRTGEEHESPGGPKKPPKKKPTKPKATESETTGESGQPGSKAHICTWLNDDTLMFGVSRVYNVKSICAELKVKKEDCCWPVILSSKGASSHIFCPCPDADGHSTMGAGKHKAPAGLAAAAKKHSKQATEAEAKKGTASLTSQTKRTGAPGRPNLSSKKQKTA